MKEGRVISSTPEAGQEGQARHRRRPGASARVAGPSASPTGPAGRRSRRSRRWRTKGLKVDADQEAYSDTVAAGNVISQTPRSGTLYRGRHGHPGRLAGARAGRDPQRRGDRRRGRGRPSHAARALGFRVRVQRGRHLPRAGLRAAHRPRAREQSSPRAASSPCSSSEASVTARRLDPAAQPGRHPRPGRRGAGRRGRWPTAEALGCEALQIFVGNPRGWAHAAGDPAEDAASGRRVEARGLRVFVHAPYLVNLVSPTPADARAVGGAWWRTTCSARRGSGAEGVVVHTGSYVGAGRQRRSSYAAGAAPGARGTAARARRGRRRRRLRGVLLEPTAGQGRSLCAGVEDLAPYLAGARPPPQGRDLPGHLSRLRRRCAARRARRSDRDRRPAGRDRRVAAGFGWSTPTTRWTSGAPAGTGTSGSARATSGSGAFRELLAHPATAGVPFIAGDARVARARQRRPAAAARAARRGRRRRPSE